MQIPLAILPRYNQLYAVQTESIELLTVDPVAGLLRLMDEGGVDKAVLTAEDAETTMNMENAQREKWLEFVRQQPERFIGMAAVDPHKGMQAIKDLEYAVKNLGMQALCLEPWLHKLRSNEQAILSNLC